MNSTITPHGSNDAAVPIDPALAPLVARLRDIGGPDDTRPEAAILDALDACAAEIAGKIGEHEHDKRAAEIALEVLRLQQTASIRPEAAGALRAAVAKRRRALGIPEPEAPTAPRRRFGLAAALEDRPPPKSVCRKLEWEIGRPPMLVGTPGAGKSFAVQAAALDLVIGRPLWGCPDFRVPGPQRVLHVDLDQGATKTLRRYKRLLRGRGVTAIDEPTARRELAALAEMDPRDLGSFDVDEGEGLVLGSLAPEELARWRAAWIAACRGSDVAFVDSLRRLAPFLDENDSRFSVVPDTMRTVSEAAQCVVVLLHHASNKARSERGQPKPTAGTRGSSAIDGAAGTQLVIEEDGDFRRVTQTRAGEAAKLPAFHLAFDDDEVVGPAGIRGIRVVYRTPEQASEPRKEAKAERLRQLADRCLDYIRRINLGSAKKSGYGPLRKQVVQAVEGNDKGLYAALDMLVREELVREEKDGRAERLWAADMPQKGSTK